MSFNRAIEDPLKRIQDYITRICTDTDDEYWDSPLHPLFEPVSATASFASGVATSTFRFGPVPQRICNRMHNVHGGATATLLDILTTVAMAPLSRQDAFVYAGVSRTLNCSYLRPIKEGSTVNVVCEAVSLGKRLAAITAKVVDADGKVYATCEHHKASIDPPSGSEDAKVMKAKL